MPLKSVSRLGRARKLKKINTDNIPVYTGH